MVLMSVGYFQPATRGELSKIFGKEVSRDIIGNLRSAGFNGSGPRSPTPGAPNSATFGDGLPVTLRFADLVGEILTAAPLEDTPPLPFKAYI